MRRPAPPPTRCAKTGERTYSDASLPMSCEVRIRIERIGRIPLPFGCPSASLISSTKPSP